MGKRLNTWALKRLPGMRPSNTWEQAWELLAEQYDLLASVIDKIDVKPHKHHILDVTVSQSDTVEEQWLLEGEERDKYIESLGVFKWDAIYELLVEHCIRTRLMKRSKKQIKNIKIVEDVIAKPKTDEDELKKLKEERNRITMKIWSWKKHDKDTSILEDKKAILMNQINVLKQRIKSKKK